MGYLDEPVLFLESDEPQKVLKDFAIFKPITCKDLGIELSKAGLLSRFLSIK